MSQINRVMYVALLRNLREMVDKERWDACNLQTPRTLSVRLLFQYFIVCEQVNLNDTEKQKKKTSQFLGGMI